jgi:DNA-binding transcriptional regulator YdaS (Cro superfamily)
VSLPIFLELGSVLFLCAAFGKRRNLKQSLNLSTESVAIVGEIVPASVAPAIELKKVFTRNEALNDFSVLKASGSQKFLAERYGVSGATVSKWLSHWAESGDQPAAHREDEEDRPRPSFAQS